MRSGVQRTNASGVATFKTVYPGWYQGRTVLSSTSKVHVRGSTSSARASSTSRTA